MKYGIAVTLFFLAVSTQFLIGQGSPDALRFSQWTVGGTSRTVGVGGAIGALGADFASLSTNPAGLGTFRRSEITFTPSLFLQSSNASLQGDALNQSTNRSLSEYATNNLGLVFVIRPNNIRWPNLNIGFGINRLADLHREVAWEGYTQGSIVDRWQDLANDSGYNNLDGFEVELAQIAGAIYDLEGDGRFESDMELNPTARIRKQQEIISSGFINEFVISFGGNFDNRLFFGVTLGIPIMEFSETNVYQEFNDPLTAGEEIPFFQELAYLRTQNNTGTGINGKFGLIYRFNQLFRMGLAVHTPTRFTIQDEFFTDLRYAFIDDNGLSDTTALSPLSEFEYRLRTPWRFIGSAGLLLGKFGFFSAEVEYLNYGSNQFDFGQFVEDQEIANQEIERDLTSSLIVRLGTELVYNKFRLRGGLNLTPNPLDQVSGTDLGWSVGLGFRSRSFFIDLAYAQTVRNEELFPYFVGRDTQPVVLNQLTNRRLLGTVGFKF